MYRKLHSDWSPGIDRFLERMAPDGPAHNPGQKKNSVSSNAPYSIRLEKNNLVAKSIGIIFEKTESAT